jgi:hypothetical protein
LWLGLTPFETRIWLCCIGVLDSRRSIFRMALGLSLR